jgi:hypothetical protein
VTARFAVVALLLATAACVPKRGVVPPGPGTPIADFQGPFDQASTSCRGVRTIRTTIRLAGRAGGQRMRGTLIAGLAQPDALRLEGVAPFGPPAFILVAHDKSATLLLPRDNRVLTGVSAADILEALAGVRLDPGALRAILSGCVTADPQPIAGHVFNMDGPLKIGYATTGYPRQAWMAIEIGHGTTAYLRQQQGQWRIIGGVLPGLEVQYDRFESGLPRRVQVWSAGATAGVPVDLTLVLSDVATNIELKSVAFAVDVPADAVPMTIAELRDAGPLGVKGDGSPR